MSYRERALPEAVPGTLSSGVTAEGVPLGVGNQMMVRLLGSPEPGSARDDVAARIRGRLGRGDALPEQVRTTMEHGLGHDFRDVVVHRDTEAASLAQHLGARAFTSGRDVFFGNGAYDPSSATGRETLAHELTHTVQSGSVSGTRLGADLTVSDPSDPQEQEATAAAARFTATDQTDTLPGDTAMLRLRGAVGNSATLGALRLHREPTAADSGGGVPEAPPYTNLSEISHDMFTRKFRDWRRLFHFANGRSMPDMLELWGMLQAQGALNEAVLELGRAQGVDVYRMVLAVLAVQARGRSSRIAFELEHETELATLEPGAATAMLNVIGQEDPIVPRLRAAIGFQALEPAEQRQVLVYAAGSTVLSVGGAKAFRSVLDDPQRSTEPQAFRGVLHSQPGIWPGAYVTDMPGANAEVTAGPPVGVNNHPFASGPANANRITVRIDDPVTAGVFNHNFIDVLEPHVRPDPGVVDLPVADEVVILLKLLPRGARAMIKRIDLNPKQNPDDAKVWSKDPHYGNKIFLSYMTAGADGVVNIFPMPKVQQGRGVVSALTHESGHALSLRRWGDPQEAGNTRWQPWRQAMASDGFQASKYAKASINEDFAEAWLMFITARGTPRELEVRKLMPARCDIFDSLIKQERIDGQENADGAATSQ